MTTHRVRLRGLRCQALKPYSPKAREHSVSAESLNTLIGKEIKRERKRADLSQADLAHRMGGKCHPQTVSDWERGESNISLGKLEEIAAILGVPGTALLPKRDGARDGVMVTLRRLYREMEAIAADYDALESLTGEVPHRAATGNGGRGRGRQGGGSATSDGQSDDDAPDP